MTIFDMIIFEMSQQRGETNFNREWRRNLSQQTSVEELKQLRELRLMMMRRLLTSNLDSSSSSDPFQNALGGR
jgi:hypothetical protein